MNLYIYIVKKRLFVSTFWRMKKLKHVDHNKIKRLDLHKVLEGYHSFNIVRLAYNKRIRQSVSNQKFNNKNNLKHALLERSINTNNTSAFYLHVKLKLDIDKEY